MRRSSIQAVLALFLWVPAAPVWAQDAVAQPSFDTVVGTVLDDPTFRRVTAGIHVMQVASGREVFGWQPDAALVPASTTKVVTAAAALDALTPSYTFRTEVFTTGEVVDGVLQGDLYIRGMGDPTLAAERLWRLLRDVRVDGIERVEGNLILDDSFFDEGPLIPGWDNPRDLEDGPSYFPPIGALQTEFGAAVVVIRPGAKEGEPAKVSFETPAGRYLALDSTITTGAPRSRTRIELERQVQTDRLLFTVSGSVPLDADTRRFRRAVHDPTAFVQGVVEGLLAQVGPAVRGTIQRGEVPEGADFLRRMYSQPLASVLADTNKYSSNFMAETVLRTLGAEVHGEGTTRRGLEVVQAYLTRIGIERADYTVVNGSGLSRDTRLTPRQLTTVLVRGASDGTIGPELIASLSIAGRDGTMRSRLSDAPPGSVRAKTGTLAGVHTLAGYFEGADGELYAFAFLANDVGGSLSKVKTLMDAFLLQQIRSAGIAGSP